jgi:BlaI family transcriptional regulator, penicillinase repressor
MPHDSPDVTDAELAVLQVLWSQAPCNRRQLTDALYPGGGPAHYTTVQKLLDRLEQKGYVRKDSSRDVRTFTATLGREDFIGLRLQDMADRLCGGSLTPLLMNLARSTPLKPGEVEELRGLLAASRKGKRKGERR